MSKNEERSVRKADRMAPETRRKTVASADSRASRAGADAERLEDGLELSQDQREQMLRDEALQNLLPDPPKKKGVHYFWASLHAPQHITWYKRMGYRLVPFEKMEGWANASMKNQSADYAGCITVNEMVLMQIEEVAYQRYMRIVHHDKPLEQQGVVRNQIDSTKEAVESEAEGRSSVTEIGGGLKHMDRSVKTPSRFE